MVGAVARALISVALALLVAGCGGSSDSESPADLATRSAYLDDLNRICAEWAHDVTKTSQHFEAVEVRAGGPRRLTITAERYEQLADGLDRLVARVRELTVPDLAADTIGGWLATTEARAKAERELAAALRARPTDSARLAAAQEQLRSETADGHAAIASYGAHECAPRTELIQAADGG